MAKYPCLGDDLGNLILSLDKIVFELLSEEPGRDMVEETYRESHQHAIEEDIKFIYSCHVKQHSQDLKDLARLHQYGDTREEIIENIREHLLECPECMYDYRRFLDEQARKEIFWAENKGLKDEKTKSIAELRLKKGYEGLVEEADILGILDY
jgi:hypothetical protein